MKHCGVNYPNRGFIVELHSKMFCLISPVIGGQELFDEVNQIIENGEIKYIILPNYLHCRCLNEWQKAYPNAIFLFPDDCLAKVQKESPIKNYFLLNKETVFEDWKDILTYEIIEGSSYMKEAVFCVIPDQSLIVADLFQRFDLKDDKYTDYDKLMLNMGGTVGEGGIPVFFRTSFKWPIGSKSKARGPVKEISSWNFDTILVSHGKHLKTNAKKIFVEKMKFFN